MDILNIRWDTGVAFWVTNFFPKQLSLICMQNCLYFEKIGMAFRLQIVHFVYKTCILLTNRAFQITNLRFNYKSRISFYKCDFLNYNSALNLVYFSKKDKKLSENQQFFLKNTHLCGIIKYNRVYSTYYPHKNTKRGVNFVLR